MSYSPTADLARILASSPDHAMLFFGVALLPWIATVLIRVVYGRRRLFWASLWGAAAASLLALAHLQTLGPPAGVSPAGLWYLVFLYAFIPVWLVLALVAGLLLTLNKRRETSS